ncbi:MAG: BACON domain-containing protein [Bacteroidales bacterium]|nr:BACON domain-containing protein [Candidatus Cryptobacteroides equifaecalis]
MRNIIFKSALLAVGTALAFSCSKSPEPETPYLFIKDRQETYEFGSKGTVVSGNTVYKLEEAYAQENLCPRLELFSNVERWEIRTTVEGDTDWLFFWPNEGSGSGRFFMTVGQNTTAQSRSADIIVLGDGKVMEQFSIYQAGESPYLSLDMGGIDSYYAVPEGCEFRLKLRTNTLWRVNVDGGDWASVISRDDSCVDLKIGPNSGDENRSLTVRIKESGETALPELAFTINQLGASESFAKAKSMKIADVLSAYTAGVIQDNVWTEGTVISDFNSLNVEKHRITYVKEGSVDVPSVDNRQMWIQDSDGTPLCVEFVSVAENCYPAGTRLKLHLVGKEAGREPETGMYRITGFSSGFVHDAAAGTAVTPVEISDLSTVAEYENRLVTLKNVQFAMPYGTYLNVDERNAAKVWEYLEDASTRSYAHILLDRYGNSIKLYTSSACPWRHSRQMPAGCGDVSGIIVRRKGLCGDELVLRMQKAEDNRIPDSDDNVFAKAVVRFGPFPLAYSADQVKADVGVADIKTSMFTRVSNVTSSDAMYLNVWSTIWNCTFSPDLHTFPTPAEANQYHALNAQQWYNGTGTTITDVPGEAWIITLSPINWKGSHYLVFASGTWNKGPKDFRLEWSTSESTPAQEWNKITDYETTSWNANYQAAPMMIRLPDEMNGLERIVIRHLVTSKSTTYDASSTIGATATNRMCYWSVLEIE